MQVGDKVYHKAGTDPVEIVALDGDHAICKWMHQGKPAAGSFPLTDLQAEVPPSRSAQRASNSAG